MPFSEITFYNFRNIQNQKVPIHYRQVFFIGINGQGKTNFLEALYALAYGRSFRASRDNIMITTDCAEMALFAKWHPDMEEGMNTAIAIKYTRGKKEIRRDGMLITDRTELLKHIPVILFNHNDIEFVSGLPENRRWFFNQCLSRYHTEFINDLQVYTKILKSRNKVLKEHDFSLLDIYNQHLVGAGIKIMRERQQLIQNFNSLFTPLFEKISEFGEEVTIEYQPSWNVLVEDELIRVLENKIDADMHRNTTTSGPHRDKFLFKVNGRNVLHEASTGQIRLISLILRITQARLYSQMSNKKPILLIDDVLLEMDREKQERLIQELPDYDQAFFTFLPDNDIYKTGNENAIRYSVHNGEYQKMK
ncbi:MAG: DNA replication/repair protein RecF [Salinispira sp.]